MNASAICCAVLLVASPLAAQGTYPACPGGVRFPFQVERLASFVPDSATRLRPTPTPRDPHATMAQFVVDTSGHVIPESLHPITFWGRDAVDQVKNALFEWRFVPAVIGARPTCQMVQSAVDSIGGRP